MDETYTPEQLRRDAIAIERMHGETLTVEWRGHQASQLRAHAAALEENARLRAERDTHVAVTERIKVALRRRGTDTSYVEWASYCRDALDRAERAEAELAKLRQHAEAMAEHWENDDTMDLMASAVTAYRRDYPEGTT